jgi:nesprin-1
VKDYDNYQNAHTLAVDWLRKTRISIQQCSDSHGEWQETQEKQDKLNEINDTLSQGKYILLLYHI